MSSALSPPPAPDAAPDAEPDPAPAPAAASARILRNSVWYGLEVAIESIVFLGSSIAVARYLGPTTLGYFSYINFFVSVVTRTCGSGLAAVTRKFMSEFLGLDQLGRARAVYHLAYRYQLLGATLIAAVGVAGILLFGDPAYRLVACILVVSIVPGVMSCVPAEANNAFEDAYKNTISAMGYLVSYVVVIVLTLYFRWGLVGIASATLIGRTVEIILRTAPLHAKLRTLPLDTLDLEVKQRVRRFCFEAIGVQLLMTIAWDRTEVPFLKAFSTLDQIAFYNVSFGLVNNLLIVPRVFSSATGMTLMVDAARDADRIDSIVRTSSRYLLLVAFPVHLGAAAVTVEAIHLTYGPRYAQAAPVLIIASILAIPRAFQEIPMVLLRAADRQKQLFVWLGITGLFNIALDWALIPHFAAVGAAWGNGVSQALGIFAIWKLAQRDFRFRLPMQSAIRLGLAGSTMAAIAWCVGHMLPGLPGFVAAIVTAVPVYMLMVRLFGGLEPGDRKRLALIGNRMPAPARRIYTRIIDFTTPLGLGA